MNAEKMLNKIGYTKLITNNEFILYVRNEIASIDAENAEIVFWLKKRGMSVTATDYIESAWFSFAELKAISKQMEELGWEIQE